LKNKIIQRQVVSRMGYVIGYWVPAYNYDIKPSAEQAVVFEQQRKDGSLALVEIEQRLRAGEAPLVIAKSINQKYPSLQKILSINGNIVAETKNDDLMTKPYTYASKELQEDIPSIKVLLTMKEGEIKLLTNEYGPGSGGRVIQLIKSTDSQFKSYDDWLKSQMTQ
jgi:hypothetical protein